MDREEQHVWAKEIERTLFPLEGNSPIALPTQSITGYLFLDKPTSTVGQAGTGAISSLTQIAQNANSPYGVNYTFPAVDNPEPDALEYSREYWEALNFVLEDSGETETIVRSLLLTKVENLESVPGTSVQDIKDVFPAIEAYLSDSKLQQFISIAESDIKDEFRKQGFRWSRLYDLSLLRYALAYKAISEASIANIKQSEDRHHVRARYYDKKYQSKLKSIFLLYDQGNDGSPEIPVKASANSVVMRR